MPIKASSSNGCVKPSNKESSRSLQLFVQLSIRVNRRSQQETTREFISTEQTFCSLFTRLLCILTGSVLSRFASNRVEGGMWETVFALLLEYWGCTLSEERINLTVSCARLSKHRRDWFSPYHEDLIVEALPFQLSRLSLNWFWFPNPLVQMIPGSCHRHGQVEYFLRPCSAPSVWPNVWLLCVFDASLFSSFFYYVWISFFSRHYQKMHYYHHFLLHSHSPHQGKVCVFLLYDFLNNDRRRILSEQSGSYLGRRTCCRFYLTTMRYHNIC